jgi:hypothetical protein
MRTARLALLAAAVFLTLWPSGCKSIGQDSLSNGAYTGSVGQVLTINGGAFTYSYIEHVDGTSYGRTAAETQILMTGPALGLTTPSRVAARGQGTVSCSTMHESDVDHASGEVGSTVRALERTLAIEPDQSDQMLAGQGKTCFFYALIQGDTGDVVEVLRPTVPAGWSARLGDATGANDLVDSDGDSIPDLGYVAPDESSRFSLEVMTASGLAGDTAFTERLTIAGHLGSNSLVADTALLSLTVLPAPLSGTYVIDGHSATFTTTQINGHPIGLQLSTTFDFSSSTNSITLTDARNLINGGCGITSDTYTKGN